MMHSWVELDRTAILHNMHLISSIVGTSTLAPVLKSNAYGHGLAEMYDAIASYSPALKWLCVAYLDEAKLLRDRGFKGRILIVAPVLAPEFAFAKSLDVEIFLTDEDMLNDWLHHPEKPKVHLKIDTGLTRQGFYPAAVPNILPKLEAHKSLVTGVCTHFANVEDVLEHEYASFQLQQFAIARDQLKAAGYNVIEHAASSASTFLLPQSRLGLCRVGISSYGFWASSATRLSCLQISEKLPELRPVMQWKTIVNQIKAVPAGTFIGYGCSFRASHDMTIAVLPIGYNEGYRRSIADAKSYVLIRGSRCPIVGRISMNLMVVDVGHIKQIQVGDEVVLIGRQGREHLNAETVADWAGTIHYEFVTGIHPHLPRRLSDKE